MEVGVLDSERLLNAISVVLLIAFFAVLTAVRRERIRVEYSVSWLLAVGSLLLLSRWRWFHGWLAELLGVEDAFALLLLAGCAFVVVVYRLSIRISGLRDSNIKLTQQLAILQLRVEMLDEKDKPQTDK